jgi:hypothetical protein
MSRDMSRGTFDELLTTKAVQLGSPVRILTVIDMMGSAQHLLVVCVSRKVREVSRPITKGLGGKHE